MAAKWHLASFNDKTMAATVTAWKAEAGEGGAFPGEVEQILAWAEGNYVHADGMSCAYGMFKPGDEVAWGICEVVVNKKGARAAWVKHLRLRLRPQLDDKLFAQETEAVTTALEIYGYSAAGVLNLKTTHKADTVKIYGRTKEQLTFLQMAATAIKKVAKKHTVNIEGRFLVLANIKEVK